MEGSQIILYSTNCPKCKVIEMKLKQKNIEYIIKTDINEMINLGLQSAPGLFANGKIMDFKAAVEWINNERGR